MTAPLPPVSGAMAGTAAEKYAAKDAGSAPPISADLPDLGGIAAQAVAAGDAWQAQAGELLNSPQGFGGGGYTIQGDHPSGADGDWPVDMSFPHEGP